MSRADYEIIWDKFAAFDRAPHRRPAQGGDGSHRNCRAVGCNVYKALKAAGVK
jgi:hypothetical protein